MLILAAYLGLWISLVAYLVYARTVKVWTGTAATVLLVLSVVLLYGGLIERAFSAGHWPLANRYEFGLVFWWMIAFIYLLLEASWRERRTGAFVLPMALLVATYTLTRPATDKDITPLIPALRSVWLQIHVLSTAIAYGAFGVAGGLALMRLLHRPLDSKDGQIDHHISEREMVRKMERAIALGFPWLTFGILSGGIWAHKAWGRYWGWDPKEVWSLVTWLWYLLILHIRSLRRWRGQRLAVLGLLGFGLVLFTYIGVPWLVRTVRLESLHGF
jgi:cytochrome c-type biogenesis protein CcsB